MGELFLILLGGAIYFIPSIWAVGKRNSGAIFALNLLLGWTFLGWVGALIWAIMDKPDIKPKSIDPGVSICPYCRVVTKSFYSTPMNDLNARIERCYECNGAKKI